MPPGSGRRHARAEAKYRGLMENHADLLVIFGITGDLARRMTFRALYRLERRGLLVSPVIGVASKDMTTGELVKHAREAIAEGGQDVDEAVFGRLARRLSYLHGDVTDAALYRRLAAQVGRAERPLYYLEVPPSLFGPIVEQLGAAKLLREGRVAVEKPFGHDLASARELDARLHRLLRESQILRVDHFLGKEPVIELEYLRFANLALAELWERTSVSAVQITMAEDFGVEGRGRFYDSVGALRDVGSAGDTQDKKAEVFRAMPPADPQPVHLDTSFARELGEPRNRTSGCCTPGWPATISSSPGRTASRRPGASCSRCSTTRPTSAPTRADPGDPTTRRPWSAVIRAGSRRGCPPMAEPARPRGS